LNIWLHYGKDILFFSILEAHVWSFRQLFGQKKLCQKPVIPLCQKLALQLSVGIESVNLVQGLGLTVPLGNRESYGSVLLFKEAYVKYVDIFWIWTDEKYSTIYMWLWEHDFGYSSKKLPQYNCVFLALTGSTEIYGSKVAKSFGRTWDELGRYELYAGNWFFFG
jgi:hypothetical protein